MNDQELVVNIVKFSGGKENIVNITNCMTRLRFELKDDDLFDIEKIKLLEGVLGVVNNRPLHIEIVLGPGRCRKCAEICREKGLYSLENNNANDNIDWKENKLKIKNSQKNNAIKNLLKTFGDVFVPLIPGVIVAGFCAGLSTIIMQCVPNYKSSTSLLIIKQILSLINISFMTYINAWVGYRVAEKYGATPILGGMLGMITNLDGINEIAKIIGFWEESMPLASILRTGKGGVFAVFIGVIILSKVEKWIRKHMPENLDTIFSPLITIVLCSIVYIICIMPIMGLVSAFICNIVEMGVLSDNIFIRIIIGYISALFFLPLVAMGMHHGLIAIYYVQLEKFGFITLYPSLAMAGAGQVGAAIAIYIIAKKVNNKKLCKVISGALPAGILGIGEPLIYGVTLPLGKPFITAGLGAGFGGAFIMLKQVAATTWGPSGILAIFIMTAGVNPVVLSMIYYVIALLISVVMGFIITKLLFSEKNLINEEVTYNKKETEKVQNNEIIENNCANTNDNNIIDPKLYYENTDKNMKIIKCKSATNGIAIGPVVLMENKKEVEERKTTNIEKEIELFDEAYKKVISNMQESININDKKIAEIIEARKMILEDESFISEIKNKIKDGFVAEYAIYIVGKNKVAEFEKMDNEYIRTRSADINDISNKLVNALCNNDNNEVLDTPSIVIVDEITPEEILEAKTKNIISYVAKKGSIMSHASIVASNIGLPYIFNADYDEKEIIDTKYAIVDAENAMLILNPDKKTIEEYNKRKNEEEKIKENYKLISSDVDNILKNSNIKIYANIVGPEDVDMALEKGAGGIGLYRTEFLYMKKDVLPTEDEQYNVYKNVVERMGNKEVIIRTMDIGADKEAKCLNLSHEENPALGKRAIRLCLDDTNLFRTQLRALLRAAVYGNEKIMFPMIANEKEIDDIKVQLEIAEQELKDRNEKYKVPPIGIMIETPAAAILSKDFAKKVDFFSIGTNDLTQYTLAVDRTGKNLDRYYSADHEAVLSLIKMTVEGAKSVGISVGVCGEIASNPEIIPKLVSFGVDEFSMAPSKIFKAKQKILECINEKNDAIINDKLFSPVDGEIVPMKEIPDKAFASGELGRCIGIEPKNGKIYAPCDGIITAIADTKHAICIKTKNGKEVLIHVGIDTVTLQGQGFELKVKNNDNINKGDLLLDFDIEYIKKAKLSSMVIIALTKE